MGVYCMEVDYQHALGIALNKRGLTWQREVEIPLSYDGVLITKRRVDFIIENGKDQLILETTASSLIKPEDVEQCLLYLHQSNYKLCLLVNFGEKPLKARRFIHSPRPDAEK